jgi:uncharacterized membrane-anchored protein YhcB (DUF1043 family)
MTKDTWAIIGTMVTIGSIIAALGGIAINQNSQLNTRINDVNTRIGDLRAEMNTRFSDLDGDVGNLRSDVREMGERLRNVEIQFAKVDQRLLTLERAIIPAAESDE